MVGIMRDGRDLAEDEKEDDDGKFQSWLIVECESNESAIKKSESRPSHWLSHWFFNESTSSRFWSNQSRQSEIH
jgi:hypothetical protein